MCSAKMAYSVYSAVAYFAILRYFYVMNICGILFVIYIMCAVVATLDSIINN